MIEILELQSTCSTPALSAVLKIAKDIMDFFQILVPIVLIISLCITFVKLISNPENTKLSKNIINSVLATVIVFFLPIFVNTVMTMLGQTFTVSACWNSTVDTSTNVKYLQPKDQSKKFLPDSKAYGKGDPNKNVRGSGSKIEGTAKKVGDVVWDVNDVTKISNLTSTQLVGILNAKGGNAKNFIPYASGLITAEHKYSVNVFFLLGVEAVESGWVTSRISRNCNNLGGVCSSSAHPSNGCGSNSNCSFAYFSSVNDFVDYHASMLHKNYLTPGGSYYHGTSPSAVVTNYCPGCSDWPGNVTSIANSLFNKVSSVL